MNCISTFQLVRGPGLSLSCLPLNTPSTPPQHPALFLAATPGSAALRPPRASQRDAMDLLCVPDEPSAPTERCPYVCVEAWDGGVYRMYPQRKGRSRLVPTGLRQIPDVPTPADQPFLEELYPTPLEELQPFLQTWLFFGLVAEFLGLNEVAPGVRLVDERDAAREIALLYEECVREDAGVSYLSGAAVLAKSPLVLERIKLAPDKVQRLVYLRQCLYYSVMMLHLMRTDLDYRSRNSIAALGELFSTGMHVAVTLAQPPIELPVVGQSWYRDYFKPGGALEAQMLRGGWCPSEIEKIRSQFQGVFTMHYMSRLRLGGRHGRHDACSLHACRAFQMDIDTYQPLHAGGDCDCAHVEVDASRSVSDILRSTGSYPVIRVEQSADGPDGPDGPDGLRLVAEPWTPGMPYVALSHVWADGLGNPNRNSLPRCQMALLARMTASVQEQAQPDQTGRGAPYRLWVDTLCCPVDLAGKLVALQSIADVYRQATHVLVLDSSLAAFTSEGAHPAELLLTTFGASAWMRRLWTLQEGALGNSLYIQFADRAVDSSALLLQLFEAGREDLRYLRMWQDVMTEFNQLQTRCAAPPSGETSGHTPPPLVYLQRALHYRTVSVASDEPLCIATLMALDTGYIAAAPDAEGRMVRAWELLSRAHGGLPVRIIFFAEETLDVPGWRWAPRSLLGSSVRDPVMGIDERILRFAEGGVDTTQKDRGDRGQARAGMPTPLGWKVRLPGCRLVPKPHIQGLPLHPWPDVINPVEDQLLLRDEAGRWVRIFDWYRSRKISVWTREERLGYDRRMDGPLCRSIDTGSCALIYDMPSTFDQTRTCLMVQVEDVGSGDMQRAALDLGGETSLRARRERAVMLAQLSDVEAKFMDIMAALACRIASDEVTQGLLSIQDRSSEAWKEGTAKVSTRIKEVVKESWAAHPEMERAVRESLGPDLEDYIWVMIPKLFSHHVAMEELPSEQMWFVD
ncbi:hypothetical protein TOPH_01923 [Tolypocladium ophioglossoides CBS 100239]|uniref:Heterokaryon incompatibility domain-containing protein n=1 Tax=Tolypocladium ophioglossoides (strain CBS 100239) TaxID=1163406 RepID=A0A0L0NHS5_TOLOC|nr:hypothetical protein TOPH_01923 [Tolypocladium ophioglossoides CBS 100239]